MASKKRTSVEVLLANAATVEGLAPATPSRLKSRIYSRLIQELAQDGPLLAVGSCKAQGSQLCVFEEIVRIAPLGERVQQMNYCRICHARVLGENVENAPIYWPHCPYVKFQGR